MASFDRAPPDNITVQADEEVGVVKIAGTELDYAEILILHQDSSKAAFGRDPAAAGHALDRMVAVRKKVMTVGCIREGCYYKKTMETGEKLMNDAEFQVGLKTMTDVTSAVLNILVYCDIPAIAGQDRMTQSLQKICSKFGCC